MEGINREYPGMSWVVILPTVFLTYITGTVYYNLFHHPLASFPGPLLARSSLAWRVWSSMSGRHHRHVTELHNKYGSVVRIAPNELSFSSAKSYEDIYGLPRAGRQHFIKGEFYDIFGAAYDTGCIGSERDPAVHAKKKRNIISAFTPSALAGQEDIVQQYVDMFIDKISGLCANGPKEVEISKWFEMLTFDTLGDMAFGESFNCLVEEKRHFWIELILDHLYEVTLIDNLRRFWAFAAMAKLVNRLFPSILMKAREIHSGHSRAQVKRRFEKSTDRIDFFTGIISKVKSGEVSMEEMTAHASTLIIAGAETTATELSAITFYVLKTPGVLEKVVDEVRSRYAKYEEIDSASSQQLPYLRAILNETLRIHPPGALGFPRVSPGATVDGKWIPAGTEVATTTWVVSRRPEYFANPDDYVPERWIDPENTDVKKASQPFSLGSRACIGKGLAFTQMSLCLAKMFFSYDMELVNKDLDWEKESRLYVMWWKAPVNVRFKLRA